MLEEVIAQRLQIPLPRVQGTVRLLRDGATIPFISRYRKEATGSLDEVQVAAVKEWLDRLTELEARRQTILDTIEGQGVLTSELRRRIEACWDPTELEDLYLPYKPRRRTRATIARERGLEPLADLLQAQQTRDFAQQARRFVTAQVPTPEEAIAGACDIVAERIAEDERVRNRLRKIFVREGLVRSKVVKGKESEGAKYADYFDASAPLRSIASHRYLAMRRGEEESVLRIAVEVDAARCTEELRRSIFWFILKALVRCWASRIMAMGMSPTNTQPSSGVFSWCRRMSHWRMESGDCQSSTSIYVPRPSASMLCL